jgi:catechol 2,3-dioxygenase
MNDSAAVAAPTFATRTPLHIGRVGLAVRDLAHSLAFYRNVIGLDPMDEDGHGGRLGAGGTTLLQIEGRPQAAPDDPRGAGLFHTAFLMPTRRHLARWLAHALRAGVPMTGAADHGVSEAFYLDDPEGNGIEVYADRPPDTWRWQDGKVDMPTKPLDVDDLLREIEGEAPIQQRAPAGLRIGHVHLRVGDLAAAEAFYRDALGLDVTRHRDGASFLSSGRYHHHLGSNIWRSRGAGRREEDRAGLAWFSFAARDEPTLQATAQRLRQAGAAPQATAGGGFEVRDPWGTRVRLHGADA